MNDSVVGVLVTDNVAVANILCGTVRDVSYFPIEVFTLCKDFITGLYKNKSLPFGDKVHNEILSNVWKKSPQCSRAQLSKACSEYTMSNYVHRLCSNADRVVYLYASKWSSMCLRFEVVDFKTGNNFSSSSIDVEEYEAVCDLLSSK